MPRGLLISVGLGAMLTAGCASVSVSHPTKTAAEQQVDQRECREIASKDSDYSPVWVAFSVALMAGHIAVAVVNPWSMPDALNAVNAAMNVLPVPSDIAEARSDTKTTFQPRYRSCLQDRGYRLKD